MKPAGLYITTIIIAAFGLLTLFLSSSVMFDLFGIREKEGNYVMFVVVANFIASLLYLFSSWKLWNRKRIAFIALTLSVIILVVAFIGLMIHINADGVYEPKTIKAMIFRTALTGIFAFIAYKFTKTPAK